MDIDEVIVRFASNSQPNTVYDVGDFATMYTRLEHTLIKEAILGLHDFVLSWLCERYQRSDFTLDIVNGSWKEEEHSQLTTHGRSALARLLDNVVDNTYIVTHGCIYRQCVGVPMGGSSSTELATLYCTYRELLFVRSTGIALRGIRWIDDIIYARSLQDVSVLHQINYGLQFGSSELNLAKANFVGITTTNEDPPFTCVYDKRLDFECDVIRLPHASSALATHTASAVVCGKLCRAWGLSSSRAAFAEQACIATLTHTGRNGTLSSIKKG